MREVIRFETSDGAIHENLNKANRHAEERYGKEITRLATHLVKIDKYVGIIDFIEKHLDDFVNLHSLKKDLDEVIELDPPNDDWH